MISYICYWVHFTHENMKFLPQKEKCLLLVIVGIVGLSFTLFSFKDTLNYTSKYINFAVASFLVSIKVFTPLSFPLVSYKTQIFF